MDQKPNKTMRYVIYAVAALAAILLLMSLMQQPEPTPAERMENAADAFTQGMEDAARELDPNRGPMERMGEAMEDAGEAMDEAVEDAAERMESTTEPAPAAQP